MVYVDRWIKDKKPIVGRWAKELYSREYDSDEYWQKLCSELGLAEQYVIDFVAIAANEILQAVNVENLTTAILEHWLGLGPKAKDAAFAQAIHKLSKLQLQRLNSWLGLCA